MHAPGVAPACDPASASTTCRSPPTNSFADRSTHIPIQRCVSAGEFREQVCGFAGAPVLRGQHELSQCNVPHPDIGEGRRPARDQNGMQIPVIGSKKVPSGHDAAACAGVAAGAGLAAATPTPPKSSPPSTAVAERERMIISRMVAPILVPTYEYHEPFSNITIKRLAPHGRTTRDRPMAEPT
jgi:hypothetical protein